ncbi:MAG: caspase family protein, partial [Methanotrichaceae archaeon]|nr:caspase family protein [Methanotrichaceae archaeon]
LIVANYDFKDPDISTLAAPQNDAEAFYKALSDPKIGGFKAEKIINRDSTTIKKAVMSFFGKDRKKDDTLLFYYTGHGMKGDDGKFYFVASDTERKYLPATAVSASYVKERMEDSFSKRQVLILDCCYGGSFMRDWDRKADRSVCARDLFGGEGRVILTASDSMQYAFEGNRREGEPVSSIYTAKLVEGLTTGEADSDGDGFVTHNDLQNYMYKKVREITPSMTPQIDSMGMKGEICIALNPHPKPAELSEEIKSSLVGPPRIREAAVGMLKDLLSSSNRRDVLAARLELERLLKDDSRKISEMAAQALKHAPIVPDWVDSAEEKKIKLAYPEPSTGVFCPACKKTHSSLLRFCPETGKEVGKRCPDCNYLTIAGARYCGSCGRDLFEGARTAS